MSSGRRSWTGARGLMHAAVIAIAVVVTVGTAAILELRAQAEETAQRIAYSLASVLGEQTARTLQGVDLVLGQLQARVARLELITKLQFREAMSTYATHRLLSARLREIPQASAIILVAADGMPVSHSGEWPVPPINLADRDYFIFLEHHADSGPVVIGAMESHITGEPALFIARRVSALDGTFLGIVVGAIRLSYFEDLYRDSQLERGVEVTLVRRNGTVLLHYPKSDYQISLNTLSDSSWYSIVAADGGAYLSPGHLAGSPLFVAVRPVKIYPLVVNVSIDRLAALAHWRHQAVLIGLGVTVFAAAILLLVRALRSQFNRLENARGSLMVRNSLLERAQQRMHESEQRLAEKSKTLEVTLETIDQGLVLLTADRRVAVSNRRANELLGLTADAHGATGQAAIDGLLPERHAMAQGHLFERSWHDGRVLEVHSLPTPDGGAVCTLTDITERRRAEAQIRFLAHHDELTRIGNRVTFRERMEAALRASAASGLSLAVLYGDLDKFKSVNDTLGHAAGDKLLTDVAARLQAAVRQEDTVARMGGDEFAILLGGTGREAAALLGSRLLEAIAAPYDLNGATAFVGLSVGIAMYPEDGEDADTLLRHADAALYTAKAGGRRMVRFYEHSDRTKERSRMTLEQDMLQALERHQFVLYYQPIVDLRESRIAGFEALLRWQHPELGLLPPAEFIPIAEETGAIRSIGRWVLHTACAEAARWPAGLSVAVNLSPAQFKSGVLDAEIEDALRLSGLPPARLDLEVTEGLLLEDTEQVVSTMAALRAQGVRLVMDDFGTAHAGLTYLRRFPFDQIKIDRGFTQAIGVDRHASAIVEIVLMLGHTLGLEVVAEGVETEEQAATLKRLGCRFAQGYLLGRPGPAVWARAQVGLLT